MSAYVDALFPWGRVRGGGRATSWCHLIADTLEELHTIAARIGMRREWFQSAAEHTVDHYDLTPARRAAAVAAGAIECDRRTMSNHMRRLRGLPPRLAPVGDVQ